MHGRTMLNPVQRGKGERGRIGFGGVKSSCHDGLSARQRKHFRHDTHSCMQTIRRINRVRSQAGRSHTMLAWAV
jgi:hypothetical protein